MSPREVSNPNHAIAGRAKAGHFTALHDVNAMGTRAAGETPHHRIVPRNAARRWMSPPRTGKRELVFSIGTSLRISASLRTSASTPFIRIAFAQRRMISRSCREWRQVDLASLPKHDVEIQLPTKPFVQLQRVIEEARADRIKVVRAGNLGIASRVALPDVASLQQRDPDARPASWPENTPSQAHDLRRQ